MVRERYNSSDLHAGTAAEFRQRVRSHLPGNATADEEDVNVEVRTHLVVLELAQPKVLESVVAVRVVFAIIAKNVPEGGGNLVVKTAKSIA